MSKLYFHCGIHKTGTTALQEFLAAHTETLASAGRLVPRAARLRPDFAAHHNLAWELARDRRFRLTRGGLNAVKAEIAGFDGDVILSSEDFEGLLPQPAALEPIAALAAETGRELVVVVYVRNQAAYVDSLFRELLVAGVGDEYRVFMAEAVRARLIRRREWLFVFDFHRTLGAVRAELGCEVRVRSHHALIGGSIIADFLDVLGAPAGLFPAEALQHRANVSHALAGSLAAFYRNRIRRNLASHEAAAVQLMGEGLERAANPPWVLQHFSDAFRLANTQLCEDYAVPEAGLMTPPPPAANATANLVKLFSFETQVLLEQVSAVLDATDADRLEEARARVQAWREWVMV